MAHSTYVWHGPLNMSEKWLCNIYVARRIQKTLACDMTRSNLVRYDSYNLSVAWLIQHTCDLTHSTYLWRDSYNIRVTWRIQQVRDTTHWICVAWLILPICYMTRTTYGRRDSFNTCLTRLIQPQCDMTRWHQSSTSVLSLHQVWHDSFYLFVTWLIQQKGNMTHSIHVWHESLNVCMCGMTHSIHAWHD